MSDFKALLQATGEDEAVSVNQRSLIEKILARYSGEHTIFRELLQNADDAGAENVEIHFRTTANESVRHDKDSLPNLKSTNTTSILARNDGVVFRDEDWSRLKKIAEGNPDEGKIGAFGVGFVKTAAAPPGSQSIAPSGNPWTEFLMELREPAPMPEPHDFARFLSTCLGFTARIRTVSMHFDNHVLFRVTKTLAPTRPLTMNLNLASLSPLKILRLEKVEEAPLQLRAEVSHWLASYAIKPKPTPSLATAAASATAATTSFASKMLSAFTSRAPTPTTPLRSSTPTTSPSTVAKPDPFSFLIANLFLRTVSATLRVSPPAHFSQEMVRATKKNLPARTVFSLIWTSKDEFEVGADGEVEAKRVFAGLLSDLETNGRVFIGFPTFQTTGFIASIAARFVSTVERESIDFQARYVNEWNRELLWAGGVLARTVYEEEMTSIARLYKAQGDKMDAPTRLKLEERALHLMRFFTFTPSTPSPVVGSASEASFFTSAARTSITIISQLGPLPASDVRLPNPALSAFLKSVPTIPPLIEAGAPRLIAAYRDKNIVRDISLEDVLADLGAHPLSIPEATACFKWWLGLAANRGYSPSLLSKLKDAAMLSVSADGDKDNIQIFPLGGFTSFLNPSVVPSQLPLPPHTLPFGLTKSLANADLVRVFGFEELSLSDWIKYLVSPALTGAKAKVETNLLLSPPFAEKVLVALSKSWANLSAPRQADVVGLLSNVAFIPTRQGPRIPRETYFSSVDLFADLPIVTFASGTVKGSLDKVLSALGVRRHVELQLVFTRLLGQGEWSIFEITRYLVGVKDTLSAVELERLRQTQWLPKEGEARIPQPKGPDGVTPKPKVVRYSASNLFEPTETFRALGLPVLDWTSAPQKWRPGSEEAKFLLDLGLLRTPSVEQILKVAAAPGNAQLQETALKYFLEEYSNARYGASYSPTKHAYPFLPAMQNGTALFAKPAEVYSNPAVALLGFPVLVGRLQPDAGRLKVPSDPPPALLVAALLKAPPAGIEEAQSVFSYLSTQVSQFSQTQIATLRSASFVPVIVAARPEHRSPSVCFFSSDPSLPPGLTALFQTLPDFGLAAKPFLTAVGVKESPSTTEIATLVLENPSKLLDVSGSAERYLSVLRTIALNYKSLSWALQKQMKTASFFLGTKRVPPANGVSSLIDDDDDDDESSGNISYELARASSLCINDEPHTFRFFEKDVLSCPQEEVIEDFAEARLALSAAFDAMGALRISGLVTSTYRTTGVPNEGSERATALRRAVAERTVLFLSERVQQHGKAELKHEVDWISSHLHVFEVSAIELVLTLNFRDKVKRVSQPASAYVKSERPNLHLSVGPDDMDFYYEAASGLCKHLLVKQRPNDVLLFMTVLQTSLKNLKRRGYNVDRILNARLAAKEAAEARFQEERRVAQLKEANVLSGEKLEAAAGQLSQLFPDADPTFLRSLLQNQQPPHVQNAANALIGSNYPRKGQENTNVGGPPAQGEPPVPASSSRKGSVDSGLFSQFKKKLRPESKPESRENGGSGSSAINDALSRIKAPPTPRPGSGGTATGAGGSGTPTSTDAIRKNVAKAVQAARPESANNISNEVSKTQVREESSYCDSTGAANLQYIQDVSGLRFYCDKSIVNPQSFAQDHLAALTRFVTLVLRPVGEVFQVDPRSLHVFHDLDSPLIAFNRGGAIYFNSRYYFSWHDAEVTRGQLHNALISVYHSLAHELAHNLVQPHDAQHSFYFSSLCETYFLRMAQLLAKSST
ncbi:hypothetical protein RQP46_005387 [Phenoliferia psychrophenolica]